MDNLRHKPLLTLIAWYEIIGTIILYVGILCSYGISLLNIALLTAIWYPYLSYYLTVVRFYDDCMVINRPLLLFWSKKSPYETIAYIRLTDGKGTMVKVYFRDKRIHTPFLLHYRKRETEKC